MKLKAMLQREQAARKQVSTTGYTEISGEETVESASVAINGCNNKPRGTSGHHQIADCNFLFSVEEYNPAASSPAYWPGLPPYPS